MSHRTSPGAQRLHQPLSIRCHSAHALRRRSLLAATAVTAVTTMAGAAFADTSDVWISGVSAPPIVVESQGSNYSEVSSAAIPIEGNLRVTIDAGVSGRVKSYISWPRFVLEDGGTVGFLARGESRTYSRPRPKSVDRTKRIAITKSDYGETVLRACVEHAERLRSQGLSNTEIFGQDRQVQLTLEGRLEYETSGISGAPLPPEVPAGPLPTVTVNCKGHEPVVASSLSIMEEDSFSDRCTLNLQVGLTTTRADEPVRFRFVDDTGKQSNAMTARTRADKSASFSVPYTASGGRRSGQIRIVGISSNFVSEWQDYDVQCGQPGGALATHMPPTASVRFGGIVREEMYRGYLCPMRVAVIGYVKGRGLAASGKAAIFIDDRYQMRADYNIVGDETDTIVHYEDLTWREGKLAGGNFQAQTAPTKTLEASFKVLSPEAETLATASDRHTFVCRAGTAVGAVGNLPRPGDRADRPGNQATESQQTAGGFASAQQPVGSNAQLARPGATVSSFAIQAPQGRVRKGEIRLSGGQTNSNYGLRFYRKTGGSYQQVRSAQLPKRMRGPRANFDLGALSGSRVWRIEICPTGSTGIANAQSCKTSDFRLPRLGAVKPGSDAPVKGGKSKLLVPGNTN